MHEFGKPEMCIYIFGSLQPSVDNGPWLGFSIPEAADPAAVAGSVADPA